MAPVGSITQDARSSGSIRVVGGAPRFVGFVWLRAGRGSASTRRHETPEPSEVAPGLVAIAVSPDLKDDLHDRWETIFGYSERWLFPDLDGFARFNGATRHFEPGFWTPSIADVNDEK